MANNVPNQVKVIAPARIHLGLLNPSANADRQFGGAGVMLEKPELVLSISRADTDQCHGPLSDRAEKFIACWRETTNIRDSVFCEVEAAPPEHVGLGLGTQLGMSVAMGLDCLFDRRDVSISERAQSVRRGVRSAVGAYGFHDGGFIVESGKRPNEVLGKLESRIDLPSSWRVMLVRTKHNQGLAGDAEAKAFHQISHADSLQTNGASSDLPRMLFDHLLPAAEAGDFEKFSESVYRYGLAAGKMFAASQGGPFLNESIADFVNFCRDLGVRGVGQSSWGPTVYCWFPDDASAKEFREKHMNHRANLETEVVVTSVAQSGASIAVEPPEVANRSKSNV